MRHFIYDTETTGLIRNSAVPIQKHPHVTEFFGLLWDDTDDSEVAYGGWLINPGPRILIPADLEIKIGITNEMVRDKPVFSHYAPQIVEAIRSADRVVAHNLSYDMDVITYELERIHGKKAVKEMNLFSMERVCTVEATENIKSRRLTLSDLHEHLFGVKFEGAHRAEIDVRALFRCYKELVKKEEI